VTPTDGAAAETVRIRPLWRGGPAGQVARTIKECQLQPSESGWPRPRLVRRAVGAPDLRGGVRKWSFWPSGRGRQPTWWHTQQRDADYNRVRVGGRAPYQWDALRAPPTRAEALKKDRFGPLGGEAHRRGGTHRHRTPITNL